MLAFAAAFVAVRPLVGRARETAALAVACLGAAGALTGFAGLVWRWYPLAIPSQALWRLSTTLTYSDAAGLVLGVCLLVAMGVELCPPLARVTVCLCAGGLLATQSRGAYVAFACASLLVPWRRYVRLAVPLAAGVALGVAAIASSPDTAAVPWLAAVVVATSAVSALSSRDLSAWRAPPAARVALIVIAVALVVAAVAGLHHEIGVRALSPSDQDRSAEWSAAFHQWGSDPVFGVGPDRLLTFHAADGSYAHFAHNEYLQIAADAGAIGLALLLLTAFAAARVVRRFDVLSSCAMAASVCWAVGGGVRLRLASLLRRFVGGLLCWPGGSEGRDDMRGVPNARAAGDVLVAGLDGCRAGWVLATVPLRAPGPLRVEVVTDLHDVVAGLVAGRLAAAAIDVPIGLAPVGPRRVDREARRRIGARRSSVFPAPVRPVLAATTYAQACSISRAVSGRGVSRQVFGILPKIHEVDRLQSPGLQARLVEMHPEVSFTELAGAPMHHAKRTPEGRLERVRALRHAFEDTDADAVTEARLRGSQPDDVLDALVGAWTARRYARGSHVQLGGDLDETGLRMEMVV